MRRDLRADRGRQGIVEKFLPFGRSCWPQNHPPPPARLDRVLEGNGIGQVKFGQAPKTVDRQLSALLGRAPSKPYHASGACGVDHELDWPGLGVYFHRGRFAGYSYFGRESSEPVLASPEDLVIGETLAGAQRLYGSRFHVTPEHGGAWWVQTAHGRIQGFTSQIAKPSGKVSSIEAGDVGCPAMTPAPVGPQRRSP